MRRIEKYKNMEIANKRLLKEQGDVPRSNPYNPISSLFGLDQSEMSGNVIEDIWKKFYKALIDPSSVMGYDDDVKKVEEKIIKREFTDEELKEITRLIQEEGLNSVQEYIIELSKNDN